MVHSLEICSIFALRTQLNKQNTRDKWNICHAERQSHAQRPPPSYTVSVPEVSVCVCVCVLVCGSVSVCECLFCSCVAPVVVGAAVAVCFRLRFMAAHRGCQWWPTAWLAQGKESGGEGSRVSARRTYVLAWLHINSGIFCCCYDASGVKVFSGSICQSVAWGKKNTVAVQ